MNSNLIISLVGIYLFVVFVLSRLIIPNLGFKRTKLPLKIPSSMQKTIDYLKKRSKNKQEFLKKSFVFITKKFHGGRKYAVLKVHESWKPLSSIWDKGGFANCMWMNYMLRVFLITSGFFTEEDIKIKHTFINFNIHQYLKVKVGKRWIYIDAWAKVYGLKFGEKPPYFI